MDFQGTTRTQPGLFYTAISRVKTGSSLYLRDFKPYYINADKTVEDKMESMRIFNSYQFKKVTLAENIFEEKEEVKLGYLNVRSLLKGESRTFINNDLNLRDLDYLCIADTGLDKTTTNEFLTQELSNWKLRRRDDAEDGRKHMGLLLLQSLSSTAKHKLDFEHYKKDKNSVYVQTLKVKFQDFLKLNVVFVYYQKTPSQTEIKRLTQYVKDCDIIMGDLNLDINRNDDKTKLEILCENNRSRLLNEITTSNNNQLDQVIISEKLSKSNCFTTSYLNFTSDHKVIVIRVPNQGNNFTTKFKQNVNFDKNKFTKRIGELKRKNSTDRNNIPTKKHKSVEKNLIKKQSTNHEKEDIIKKTNIKRKNESLHEKIIKKNKTKEVTKKKAVSPDQSPIHRSFQNLNLQTCWLNSSIQLMLAVFDEEIREISVESSELWKCFLQYQAGTLSQDPNIIKNILFGNLHSNFNHLMSGQQDPKEFFECLEQYQESWPDVYDLLKIKTKQTVKCQACQSESGPELTKWGLQMEIPNLVNTKTSIVDILENHLNKGEVISDWKCGKCLERGCRKTPKILDLLNTKYLVVSLNRAQQDENQESIIDKTSVTIDPQSTANISNAEFIPIAVIQHSGFVTDNDTRGHYTVDILKNSQWYRYSDDEKPIFVERPTDQGYIYLLKKL